MASNSTEVVLTWLDKAGKTAKMIFYFAKTISGPVDTTITALVALIRAISGATCIQIATSAGSTLTGTQGSGLYSAEDKAVLTVTDNNGKAHNVNIPRPKSTIFTSGNEIVDVTNTNVTAFITALEANCIGEGGATFTQLESGRRRMKKPLKK